MLAGTLGINFESNEATFMSALAQMKTRLTDLEGVGSKTTAGIASGFKTAGAALSGLGVGIAAIGTAALAATSDVNSAFRILIVRTGETGDSLNALKADFASVFSNVPATAKEVADTIAQIHQRTSQAGEGLRELATQELELAHITGADLGAQVEATTKLFSNWRIETAAQSDTLDFLFKVSQNTGVGVTQLTEQLNTAGPVMRAVGISFEQGAAMIGAFDKAGLNSQQMIAGMSVSFRKLVQSGQDPLQTFSALIEKIKNTSSAMEANELAVKAFGRGAAGMSEAIKSGRLDVEALLNTLKDSKSTITGTAESTRTFSESMEILKNRVELALAPLGREMVKAMKDLLPYFERGIALIADLSKQFTELDPSTKKIIGSIVLLTGALATGRLALAGLSLAIGPIAGAFGVLAGPAAIGLVVAALITLGLTGSDTAGAIGRMWAKLKGDSAGASVEVVSNIRKITDALQVAGAAWIGFKLGGPVGAGLGAAVGIATLPPNPNAISNITTPAAGHSLITGGNQPRNIFGAGTQQAKGDIDALLQYTRAQAYTVPTIWKEQFDKAHGVATKSGMETGTGHAKAVADGIRGGRGGVDAAGDHALGSLKPKGAKAGGEVAKSIISGFQEGIEGLSAAFAKLESSDLSDVFDRMGKKARAGMELTKEALKAAVPVINEWLSRQGEGFKISEGQYAGLSKTVQKSLDDATIAWKKHQLAVDLAAALMQASLKSGLGDINTLLKENGIDLTLNKEIMGSLTGAQKTQILALDGLAVQNKKVNDSQVAMNLAFAASAIVMKQHENATIAASAMAGLLGTVTQKQVETLSAAPPVLNAYKVALEAAFMIGAQKSIVAITSIQDAEMQLRDAISKNDVPQIRSAVLALSDVLVQAGLDQNKSLADAEAGAKTAMSGIVEALKTNGLAWGVWGAKAGAVITETNLKIDTAAESARGMADKIRDSVKRMGDSIGDLGSVVRATAALDIAGFGQRVIDTFARLGDQSRLTGNALIQSVRDGANAAIADFAKLVASGQRTQAELVAFTVSTQEAFKRWVQDLNKLPGALDEVFNKLASGAKKQVSGIFDVINNLPGVFGDNLRKSTDVITKWITQIDGVLKGLHKIFASIPDGLSGAIASVIAIFRGTTSAVAASAAGVTAGAIASGAATTAMASATAASATVVETAWNQMASTASAASATIQGAAHKAGDAVDAMGKDSEDGASKMGSAIGKITQALAGISLVVAGHAQGGLQGGITGALGGMMAGAVFGPWGAAIGGAVGLFAGLFGGGKTELQKAQEKAQLQQAKDAIKLSQQQVEQAFEQTKQSILETANKARELLEAITFYTKVPKDAFKAFFEDLDKLMKAFAEHAKSWMTDASAKIRVFSDDMKAVLEAIAQAPTALVGIGKYLGIPEASIAQFFSDLGKVIIAFETLGEDFTRKFLRHTRQFAERISDAVALIPDITTGISGLVDIKPIPVGALDIWEDSLRQVTTRIGQIAENFDKYTAKLIGFFAQQIGPAVTLWKDSIDAIRAMVDLPMPTAQSFVNLFEGIKQALDGFSGLATSLSTDALVKAQSIAEMSMSIFAAIKSAVESFTALRDYKAIAQESIDAILSDFKRAIILLNLLLLDAIEFESKAKTFDGIVTSGAAFLTHGMTTFVGAFTDMAAKLLQLPSGGTSITPGPGFGSVGGMSTQGLSARSMSAQSVTYINIGDLNIPADSTAGQLIKKLVDELAGIATGGMQRDPLLA